MRVELLLVPIDKQDSIEFALEPPPSDLAVITSLDVCLNQFARTFVIPKDFTNYKTAVNQLRKDFPLVVVVGDEDLCHAAISDAELIHEFKPNDQCWTGYKPDLSRFISTEIREIPGYLYTCYERRFR